LILSLIYKEKIMSNMTRKEFLKLTGTAAGAGLMATSGFGSVARAQSSELPPQQDDDD
jgi:anaerobic selenocysteine-containing dehydrogenase